MSAKIELLNGKGRGEWQRILYDEFGDHPHWSAIIRCPDCGVRLPIPNHTIAVDGQVTPSVGHQADVQCSWHVSPRLLGWAPVPTTPGVRPIAGTCERCGTITRQLGGWGTWSGGTGLICAECVETRRPLLEF